MYIATDLSKKKTKKRMTKMERSFVSCNVGFRTGNALRVAADSPAKRNVTQFILQLYLGNSYTQKTRKGLQNWKALL